MLKKCIILAITFWIIILNLIIFQLNFTNTATLTIIQGLILSALIYPMFCSILISKSLLYFFKNSYFKCATQGLSLYCIATLLGITLMIPFIQCYKSMTSHFKLASSLVGGFNTTIWLLCLSKFAFIPFWPTKKFITAMKLSWQLSKKIIIQLFLLILKNYLKFILIIPSPWAIKNFIVKINKLKLQLTQELKTTIKYKNKKN